MKFSMYDPDSWFWIVQDEFELLGAYVSNVENQVEMGLIKSVKSYIEDEIEEIGENGNPRFSHQIRVYDGLDDSTWSIEKVFNNYFPSLHRRSCFITAYSFLEHSLEDLCQRYSRSPNFKITLRDLNGKGIDRSKLYLQKVVGLDLSNAEKAWSKVKELQKVRNCIVHNDGCVTEDRHSDVIKRISYVHLQGNELVLEEGFLEYTLACSRNFCRTVHEAIEAQKSRSKLTKPPTPNS